MSDIRVIGLVMGTHVIEDIAMDVPHGVTVTIPADKAAISKDLWRGIGQKCMFQLPSAPPPAHVPIQRMADDTPLHERIHALQERNKQLEEENQALKEGLRTSQQDQQRKLDSILSAIQTGAFVQRAGKGVGILATELADGQAPTFIPSEIRPKEAETRIESRKEEAEGAGISGAVERLRKMRGTQ